MNKLILLSLFALTIPMSSFAVTCGIYETGNIPTTNLFKKALAACELGEVVLFQSKFGRNNSSNITIDKCDFNLSLINGVDGFIKIQLSDDKRSVSARAFGVTTELNSTNGAFYFMDEVQLGSKGLFVLKCADIGGANKAKAVIYPKGWHPGASK